MNLQVGKSIEKKATAKTAKVVREGGFVIFTEVAFLMSEERAAC